MRSRLRALCSLVPMFKRQEEVSGFLSPCEIDLYDEDFELLVDESLLNLALEQLKNSLDLPCREMARELACYLDESSPVSVEGLGLRRFRMRVGDIKHYLGNAIDVPVQSFYICEAHISRALESVGAGKTVGYQQLAGTWRKW